MKGAKLDKKKIPYVIGFIIMLFVTMFVAFPYGGLVVGFISTAITAFFLIKGFYKGKK